MTRRDRQAEAKKAGRPWEVAKAFEHAAPCGTLHKASHNRPTRARPHLARDQWRLRQEGDLAQMIWKVPEIIAYLSGLFTLAPGDVIFTGTPSGVGPVKRGDRLKGGVEGMGELGVAVV